MSSCSGPSKTTNPFLRRRDHASSVHGKAPVILSRKWGGGVHSGAGSTGGALGRVAGGITSGGPVGGSSRGAGKVTEATSNRAASTDTAIVATEAPGNGLPPLDFPPLVRGYACSRE